MKYYKYIYLIAFTLISVFFLTECHHHDPKPPEPDPCAGKSATGANFLIYENMHGSFPTRFYVKTWIDYSTDTVTNEMKVLDLVASDDNALSYLWHIGSETYTTKKVTIDFSSRPAGQNSIPITLTVTKPQTNSCFPSDTGTITYTKLLTFQDTSLVSGYFRGIRTDTLGQHPSDSFTVYLNPYYHYVEYDNLGNPAANLISLVAGNLYPGCQTNVQYEDLIIGYKEVYFSGSNSNNCNNVGGRAILGPTNDDIIIYYSNLNSITSLWEDYIFKGKRVQ